MKAFVLIHCIPAYEEHALDYLKELGTKAYLLLGEYDIIAEIEARNIYEINEVVEKIRKMKFIKLTSTHLVVR